MKRLPIFAAALMLCNFASAQSKPADPPPAKVPVTSESRDALRAAIHKQDQDEKKISDLTARFVQMQSEAKATVQELQADQQRWAKLIEDEKKQAYVNAKLDPAKYDLDLETMEFSPKPEPKAEAKK